MFLSPFPSPVENSSNNQECNVGATEASCSSSSKATEPKDSSCVSQEESWLDSCDSDEPFANNAAESADKCKDLKKSKVKLNQLEKKGSTAYPEPRLPYPCISSLSKKDQNIYLGFLRNRKIRDPPQVPDFLPYFCFKSLSSSSNILN